MGSRHDLRLSGFSVLLANAVGPGAYNPRSISRRLADGLECMVDTKMDSWRRIATLFLPDSLLS